MDEDLDARVREEEVGAACTVRADFREGCRPVCSESGLVCGLWVGVSVVLMVGLNTWVGVSRLVGVNRWVGVWL